MAGLLGTDQLDSVGTSGILQGRLEEADHSSTNWYFPREELERTSPSLRDGIDTRRETYFRKSYCTFLQDLGMRLKVPQVTIATAITFCHRFYLRQSHAKNDRFMIATVCMFLAGKVEETPRVLKDVIIVSYTIRNKKDPHAAGRIKQKETYEAQKELVLYGERLVLTILGFDLNVHHPYRPLVAAIKKFKVAQHALAQVAWNFVNDGLRTSLCLQFKPHHIAAGAIFLAAKFLKVKLPNDGERPWWQEFDVTPKQLEEVSNQMLELYEQNRAVSARNEPNQADANTGDKPDASSPAANGHHPALASSAEPKQEPPGEFDTRENGLVSAPPPEPERLQQRPKEVPNGYESRSRPELVDKRRVPEPIDPSQQQQQFHHHHHHQEDQHKELDMSGDRLAQQQESSKRKRESSEKKWSTKPEEGELPPPPPPSSRSDDYYHSRSGGDKRYDDHRRDSQDYRYHGDHHSYHYQSQRGDGDRSRNHSKDRDWQDRDPKKSRHKYS